jgi:amidase
VKDAAYLLSICVGVDIADESTKKSKIERDYTKYCKQGSLKGKRIGVDTSYLKLQSPLGLVFMEALTVLERQGAVIVPIHYEYLQDQSLSNHEFELLLYELKHGLGAYLSKTKLPYKILDDIIAANKRDSLSIMSLFGQEIFYMAQQKGALTDQTYLNALTHCTQKSQVIVDSVMAHHRLDVICGPTMGHTWEIDHKNGDAFNGPASYGLAARSTYPSITVPMGEVDKLPVGICFMAGAWQEGKIISVAYDYEQHSKKLKNPKL